MLFPSPVFFFFNSTSAFSLPLTVQNNNCLKLNFYEIGLFIYFSLNMSIHHYRSTFNSKVQYISFEIVCVSELSTLPCFLLKFF